MTVPTLIDKYDNLEIVRDKIGQILADETASQQALATAAGKDPDGWRLRVFVEHSNAWEQWLNEVVDSSPIVNVTIDGTTNDHSASSATVQTTDATVFVDIFGVGISEEDGTGHKPGDKLASFEAWRAHRLVRNILMYGGYFRLDLPAIVGRRWHTASESFKVTASDRTIQTVAGVRMTFSIRFPEFPVGADVSNILEEIYVELKRDEDGMIIAEALYDYSGENYVIDRNTGDFVLDTNTGERVKVP